MCAAIKSSIRGWAGLLRVPLGHGPRRYLDDRPAGQRVRLSRLWVYMRRTVSGVVAAAAEQKQVWTA